MDEGLRKKIKASAKSNGLSMNGEIVSRLSKTFCEEDIVTRLAKVIVERIEELVNGKSKEVAGGQVDGEPGSLPDDGGQAENPGIVEGNARGPYLYRGKSR